MSSLYELTSDYDEVLHMLDNPDIDEQAIIDTCDAIEGAIEYKADSYAFIIGGINADVDAIKNEQARLAARRKALENRAALLKRILEDSMRVTGRTKFKTVLHSFAIQKNGGKAPLDIYGKVPAEYNRIIEQPNTDLIREVLESGGALDFACLQERGESLRIR